MSPTFDELVSGDSFITEAVTRRASARHTPRHALGRSRHARRGRHVWPYRVHVILGVLTGVLTALVVATLAIVWSGVSP